MEVRFERGDDEYLVFCEDKAIGRIIKGSGDHYYYQPNNMGYAAHPDILKIIGGKIDEVDL